jgi:hypothetical protein
MPVQSQPQARKTLRVLFEARYDEGYRYLDRCGQTLVSIRKHSLSWVPGPIDPQRSVIGNAEHDLTLNMNSDSLLVANNAEMDASTADKKVEILAKEAEALYKIITESLSVPNTTRVGLRCQFLAPADALEEAYRFLCKVPASPLRDDLLAFTKCHLRNSSMALTLEDPDSGVRKRVEVSAVIRVQAGAAPITGLATDEGHGGIMVDIDTFTRPDRGHLAKVSMFIHQHYAAAKLIATHVIDWLVKHQK